MLHSTSNAYYRLVAKCGRYLLNSLASIGRRFAALSFQEASCTTFLPFPCGWLDILLGRPIGISIVYHAACPIKKFARGCLGTRYLGRRHGMYSYAALWQLRPREMIHPLATLKTQAAIAEIDPGIPLLYMILHGFQTTLQIFLSPESRSLILASSTMAIKEESKLEQG